MISCQRCIALILTLLVSTTVARAQSVGFLELPATPFDYVDYAVDSLPAHFGDGGLLTATSGDNTPDRNPITNEGATLGRVLFYDKRLSHDNSLACSSCHQQELGFSDSIRFSEGIDGRNDGTPFDEPYEYKVLRERSILSRRISRLARRTSHPSDPQPSRTGVRHE